MGIAQRIEEEVAARTAAAREEAAAEAATKLAREVWRVVVAGVRVARRQWVE